MRVSSKFQFVTSLQITIFLFNSLAIYVEEFAMESKVSIGSTDQLKWWSEKTVAVVTGANKGIGFALVKILAELGLTVVLTSRDIDKGKAAGEQLRVQKLHVKFCQLDGADPSSIAAFASWLHRNLGGLDILVNNAGATFNQIGTNSVEHAEIVIRINFYGPKLLIEALLPLFRLSAGKSRILNISSRLGLINKVRNHSLKKQLQDENRMSEERINQFITEFLNQVKRGVWKEGGWPDIWTDYSVSKLALNTYSRLLAKQHEGKNLSVNCFCPGYTKTTMTGGTGVRTAEEAAEVAATDRLAVLPPTVLPTGKFIKWSSPIVYSKM